MSTVDCKTHTAHKNTLCGQNVEFLVLEPEIKIMTKGFKGLIKSVSSCADSDVRKWETKEGN